MELIKEIGFKEKTIHTGKYAGVIKNVKHGLFKCEGCGKETEHVMYTGKKRKSCGASGCRSKTSTKYGHRKLPEGTRLRDNPHYSLFNDFYNRNIKHSSNIDIRWNDFNNFYTDMFEEYTTLKSKGTKAITLFVTDKGRTISASNSLFVDASSLVIKDYSVDIANNVYHTKRLAVEIGALHSNVMVTAKRIGMHNIVASDIASVYGFISKPDTTCILTLAQYTQLKEVILLRRSVKNAADTLYLLESNNLVKIGVTSNITKRLQSLRGASAVAVTVKGTYNISNVYKLEKELHEKYKEFNSHGEWFNLNKEQVKEIITYLDNKVK